MFCQNCNTENTDNAAFCKNCGASLMNQPSQQENNQQQTYQQAYGQAYANMEKIYSTNPVINILKKHASSTLFFVACILFSIYAFFGLFAASIAGTTFESIVDMIQIPTLELYYIKQIMSNLGGLITISNIISMIPVLLVLWGVWLIYTAGKDTSVMGMRTSGIAIIKVMTVIELVFFLITIGVSTLLIIYLINNIPDLLAYSDAIIGGLDGYTYEEAMFAKRAAEISSVIAVVAMIALIVVFVIGLIFRISAIKTLNNVKNIAQTGIPTDKISIVLVVMMFIIGGSNILSFDIAGIAAGVAYILFGIVLVKLKNEMQQFRKLNIQPDYQAEIHQTIDNGTTQSF